MSSSTGPLTRRERLRAQTMEEIRTHGYAQIADGGPSALSLNGIAKAMGMSGPAMYRYFDSRDELLATLVSESYEALADALTAAARAAGRRTPERRLRAVADAYRAWALASPHRYRLVYGSVYGSGALDPERVIPAAHRSMLVVLESIADTRTPGGAAAVSDPTLRRQLTAWTASRADGVPTEPATALLGLSAWTRMHGIVSLEIEGFFEEVGVDAGRLFQAELDGLLAQDRA